MSLIPALVSRLAPAVVISALVFPGQAGAQTLISDDTKVDLGDVDLVKGTPTDVAWLPSLEPGKPEPYPDVELCLSASGDTSPLVVTTHYPDEGDVRPAPFPEVHPVGYERYSNRVNDFCVVTADRVEVFREAVVTMTASDDLAGLDPAILGDFDQAVDGAPTIQIVNNLRVPGDEGALYTVFLPPGWTRDDGRPIILSGNGAGISNNARIYNNVFEPGGFDLFPAQAAAAGFIVATSNAGGTEGQGIDERTLVSVGAFFEFMARNGANPKDAVTVGASRGGGAALVWAANPLKLDYDVHSVFALVPPTHIGSLTLASYRTYPGLSEILELVTHDPDAWTDVDTWMPVVLEALTGTTSVKQANELGPMGLVERLVDKRVVIAAGTHDAYVPLSQYLAFERRLAKLGVEYLSIVTLANGHERSAGFERELDRHLYCMATGQCAKRAVGRQYYIDIDPAADVQVPLEEYLKEEGIDAKEGVPPAVVQLPYRIGADDEVDIEVCGAPGSDIQLRMTHAETGEPVFEERFTLAGECKVLHPTLPLGAGTTGVHEWSFAVDGQEISPYNTPFGSLGSTQCEIAHTFGENAAPHPVTTFAYNDVMNWGLDQYSASPCAR